MLQVEQEEALRHTRLHVIFVLQSWGFKFLTCNKTLMAFELITERH